MLTVSGNMLRQVIYLLYISELEEIAQMELIKLYRNWIFCDMLAVRLIQLRYHIYHVMVEYRTKIVRGTVECKNTV
jgi:hypothetical protein